jgi:hypothetical protein
VDWRVEMELAIGTARCKLRTANCELQHTRKPARCWTELERHDARGDLLELEMMVLMFLRFWEWPCFSLWQMTDEFGVNVGY